MARRPGHENCESCPVCGLTDCPDCDTGGRSCPVIHDERGAHALEYGLLMAMAMLAAFALISFGIYTTVNLPPGPQELPARSSQPAQP